MPDFEILQTYASWAGTAVPDKLPGICYFELDGNHSVGRILPFEKVEWMIGKMLYTF